MIFPTHINVTTNSLKKYKAMAQSIGDGSAVLDSTLARIAQEPYRLEIDRNRFNRTPPPIAPPISQSGETTDPGSPVSESAVREEELKWKIQDIRRIHFNTTPGWQFSNLVEEEKVHIELTDLGTAWRGEEYIRKTITVHHKHDQRTRETVKKQWIEQGIWKDEWSRFLLGDDRGGFWGHEEPPSKYDVLRPVDPTQHQVDKNPSRLFCGPQPKPATVAVKLNREASRPIRMFFYQIKQERKRILERRRTVAEDKAIVKKKNVKDLELLAIQKYGDQEILEALAIERDLAEEAEAEAKAANEETEDDHIDLNSQAYERVKESWIRRNIWMEEWTVLPGRTWKHEYPFSDFLDGSDLQDYLEEEDSVVNMLGLKEERDLYMQEHKGKFRRGPKKPPGLIPASRRRSVIRRPHPGFG